MGRKPIFHQVAQTLRTRIRNGALSVGDALPAERTLAAELGVSRLTLRKALEVIAGDGLVDRKPGRGVFVAKATPAGRAKTVLYIGETQEHVYRDIHAHLCAEGQARGLSVIAFTPTGQEADLGKLRALTEDVAAVICDARVWQTVRAAVPKHATVVRFTGLGSFEPGDRREDDRGCVVSSDTYRAAKIAVEHLTSLGHRRIALMDGGTSRGKDPNPLCWTIHARHAPYLGYRSALREAGIDAEIVLATPRSFNEEWKESDFDAARHFLASASERPTAFVCGGDFRAGPLIRAANEAGLSVPKDVSVIGMGNTPWAEWLTPPLTSVALGEAELAHLAMLLAGEAEMSGDVIFRVTPRLVERRSTQPPPNKKGFR